ncbi:MAG: hypothetical protein GYA51_02420 [Candidatus Methanofastidiosa archaeon]|nr:hypothetical protein [Candidatus Methanofastidiosa archaeon]
MGKLENFAMILIVISLVAIPIAILGDTINHKNEDTSLEHNNEILEGDSIPSPKKINDADIVKDMQNAIDTLELKGIDTTELKNLKTDYAAYNNEEKLASLEDDFENVAKYRNEKENILVSFLEILKDQGYHNFNIYEYSKNIEIIEDGNFSHL